MGSGNWILPVALDVFLVLVLALLWREACRVERPRARLQPEPAWCPCGPRREPEVAVVWHPSDAEATRALVSVERVAVDEIEVALQPVDGSDQAAFYMPRATSDVLSTILARARNQEIHDG